MEKTGHYQKLVSTVGNVVVSAEERTERPEPSAPASEMVNDCSVGALAGAAIFSDVGRQKGDQSRLRKHEEHD